MAATGTDQVAFTAEHSARPQRRVVSVAAEVVADDVEQRQDLVAGQTDSMRLIDSGHIRQGLVDYIDPVVGGQNHDAVRAVLDDRRQPAAFGP